MRHRIGVVLAVVLAGELFFAGAWGYLRLLRLPAPLGQLSDLPAHGGSLISDKNVLAALAAVAGTGLLAGILIATPRISPLAAGLPGLLLLGWTGLYLVSVRQAVDLIPLRSDAFGAGFEAMLYNGTLAAAGFAMIIPMFVPSRWRSRAEEPDDLIPSLAGTPGSSAPSGLDGRPGVENWPVPDDHPEPVMSPVPHTEPPWSALDPLPDEAPAEAPAGSPNELNSTFR